MFLVSCYIVPEATSAETLWSVASTFPKSSGSSLPIQWGRVPCTDGHALDPRDRAASPKGREGPATLPHAFMAVSQKQSPGNRMNRRVNKRRKPLAAYPPHSYPSTSSPSPRTGLTVPTPPLPSHKPTVARGYTKFAKENLKRGFTIFPLSLRFLGEGGVQEVAHNLSTLYQHPDRKLIQS